MKTVNVKREIDVPEGGALCADYSFARLALRRCCCWCCWSGSRATASLRLALPRLAVTVKCGSRTITVTGPRGTLTRSFKTINFAIQQEKDQKKDRKSVV